MLHINHNYQLSFSPTHDTVSALNLHYYQPKHELVYNLRRIFSRIVSGNIKEEGVLSIEKNGPFHISGDPHLMAELDSLLIKFSKINA